MNHLFFKPSTRTAGSIVLIAATALSTGCSKSTTSAPHTQVEEVGVFKVAQQALQMTRSPKCGRRSAA
jgi:membrane fusion protein (multidrug efflux system)